MMINTPQVTLSAVRKAAPLPAFKGEIFYQSAKKEIEPLYEETGPEWDYDILMKLKNLLQDFVASQGKKVKMTHLKEGGEQGDTFQLENNKYKSKVDFLFDSNTCTCNIETDVNAENKKLQGFNKATITLVDEDVINALPQGDFDDLVETFQVAKHFYYDQKANALMESYKPANPAYAGDDEPPFINNTITICPQKRPHRVMERVISTIKEKLW